MTRLVNAMRDDIAERMMKHTFDARVLLICKTQSALASIAYIDAFSKKEHKTIESLPDGWLQKFNGISVKFGDKVFTFNFAGNISNFRDHATLRYWHSFEEKPLPFPYNKGGQTCMVYDEDHPICREMTEWLELTNTLANEVTAARKTLTTALNSYHTTEKLIEAWPEIAPFVVPLAPVEAPNLPALPTSDLNAMFGLPVSDAE